MANSGLVKVVGSLAAFALITSSCAQPADSPAPTPRDPGRVCAADREADDVSAEAPNVRPYRQVDPVYPSRAYWKRIDGWVCVEFTIANDGSVKDARVMDASPEGYFEEASLKAIRQWVYKPIHEDREIGEHPGIRIMFDFAAPKK